MKEVIRIGAVVDDGSGDYLRKGGEKINNNFNEIYHQLGDSEKIHESGAWKTITSSTTVDFGRSLAVNTSSNEININLPKGNTADYNKTIKLRDVWKTWDKNPVTLYASAGDTIKGKSSVILDREFMDIELVYCSPGRWEYIPNKRVDLISNSDLSTVASKSFIAEQDQTTFTSVFGNDTYNPTSVEVYYRGNLLYYGDEFTGRSEYGSLKSGILSELDGINITLSFPCDEGDTVTIVTYMDGIASWRTSYISKTVLIRDQSLVDNVPQNTLKKDLLDFRRISIDEFDISIHEKINPSACEIFLNGVLLLDESSITTENGYCSIDGVYNEQECLSINGTWELSALDYELVIEDGSVVAIEFARLFNDRDVVTLKCFNNNIGTLMEWDGSEGIREKSEQIFITSDTEIQRHLVEYSDFDNPSQETLEVITDPVIGRISNIQDMFDIFHPIGSIYENAHNPENPAKYMGLGLWKRYQEGKVIVSWSSDSSDTAFGLNNNNIVNGTPSHTSGGTGGVRGISLGPSNIPNLDSSRQVLVKDSNGIVTIGACEFDPDDQGPDLKKYTEQTLKVNDNVSTPVEVSIIQPYVTAHRWIRVG